MLKHDFIKELNEKQAEAVTYGDGPLLVVAGAGSGKTRTLAYRVAYLIDKGIPPERILLLTFTRRAANEMIKRAASVLGEESSITARVWGGTFHAIANRLLRIYGSAVNIDPDYTIIDQSDAQDMLQVIRHKIIDKNIKGRFPRKNTLIDIYSQRINSCGELEQILEKRFPWCIQWKKDLKKIYREYIETKQNRNILDYDDLLIYWKYLLYNSKASESIQARFDHILVDEYQDTNRLQAEILLGMRQHNKNIMVVGDDDQSIYSFRAATVKNILDFPSLFPGTHIVTLEQNYRSCETILRTTNLIISQAKNRFPKNLYSTREGNTSPILINCSDEEGEAETIINKILYHYEQGTPLRSQAVLFRAANHSAALEFALIKKEIPFHKWGGLKFLEAAHIKDFISFLRIIENPRDEISWFRILQLFEGIGPSTASSIYEFLSSKQFDLNLISSAPVGKKIQRILFELSQMYIEINNNKTSFDEQLYLISKIYIPLIEKNYENPTPRRNDIEHLIELASSYRKINRFLDEITLDPPNSTSDFARSPYRDEDYLILSTIHSAKGCEWDIVYIIHAADGCIPSDMSTETEEEIEEELRLAYVAMTRARNQLYISWPMRFYSYQRRFSDYNFYSQCSRFFTKDVLDTMQCIFQEGITEYDNMEKNDLYNIDIKKSIKEMWD